MGSPARIPEAPPENQPDSAGGRCGKVARTVLTKRSAGVVLLAAAGCAVLAPSPDRPPTQLEIRAPDLAHPLTEDYPATSRPEDPVKLGVWKRINADRAAAGLTPVAWDEAASRVADAFCARQIQEQTRGHFLLNGLPPYARMGAGGGLRHGCRERRRLDDDGRQLRGHAPRARPGGPARDDGREAPQRRPPPHDPGSRGHARGSRVGPGQRPLSDGAGISRAPPRPAHARAGRRQPGDRPGEGPDPLGLPVRVRHAGARAEPEDPDPEPGERALRTTSSGSRASRSCRRA